MDYKQKCGNFQRWFTSHSAEVEKLMDQSDFQQASKLMQTHLEDVVGEAMFQLYKPENENRYILELNAATDNSKKVIFKYFCDQLDPQLKNKWSFNYYHHAYKGTMNYQGTVYNGKNMSLFVTIDEKRKRFDLEFVKDDSLKKLNSQDSYMVLYMLLLVYIGELTTDAYVGRICYATKLGNLLQRKKTMLKLDELYGYIQDICVNRNWTMPKDITLIADSFETSNKAHDERKDICQGTSYCLDLLNEESQSKHLRNEYILSCGIGYYTIVIKRDISNNLADRQLRDNIEKEITKIMGADGIAVNNARGNHRDYVDYFLYDSSIQSEIEKYLQKFDTKLKCVNMKEELEHAAD